jgi:glycosyltransferase involved in cell wall biosynthesis
MSRPPISVLLPTYNNAPTIRDTLESICWAEEILVVDSYSTDTTLDICREYKALIIQHEYINSAKQKNWAAPQCQHEWILQIDTDETLEQELLLEIEAVLSNVPITIHAFRIPRKNYILGRWVQHGGLYPDYQTRLFRRDNGRWQEREVHAHVTVSGQTVNLHGHLLHDGMPHISHQLRNIDRYTRYEADEFWKNGRSFRALDLILHPWLIFLYRYLWLQGFRAGWRGLILSVYLASYDFMAKAKLWEIEELGLNQSPGK